MYRKTHKMVLLLLMTISLFTACSSDSSNSSGNSGEVSTTSLSGVAQKGPFIEGSKVSLCRLDDRLVCTSNQLESKVTDEKGTYRFEKLSWSGLSKLSVSGYYFDEVTQQKSTSPATLTAIIEIKSDGENRKNVNVLTHLRAQSFKKRMDAKESQDEAGKASVEDIKKIFNVSSDDFTALDLTDFSQGKVSVNAELLRISTASAKSSNPIDDLEKLMQIYEDGGFSAVLASPLYKKLMQDAKDINVKETLKVLGVHPDIIAGLNDADLKFTPIIINLADINISVVVKDSNSTTTGIDHTQNVTIFDTPTHGGVSAYLVGGEYWSLEHNSTDCFTGVDSFVYKVGDDYGRVNVTIVPPQYTHANDINVTLFNDKVINSEYLIDNKAAEIIDGTVHGTSSIFLVANEFMHYSYDPDDDFIGSDFFEYKVSDTIEGCSYSDTARVNFTVLGSVHLFSWNDDVHGIELWRTDGTVAGTTMVKDIKPGDKYSYSNATPGVKIDGINYFAADDGNHSTELWRTDGTESGTYMVKDINPGLKDTSYPYDLSVIGNKLYFFALSGDNNGSNYKGNKGIWVSDGTESGTQLVEALGDYSNNSYGYPGYLHALGDKLLFAKDDAAGGGNQWEPWISDGIHPSSKLKDIWPGDNGSSFIRCVEMNSKCYSNADDYTHGSELWVTDGTSSGTLMVKDINENNSSTTRTEGSVPTNITVVGDRLFFVAFDTVQGISLFKSDGTQNGTVLVKDSFADENETDAMTRYAYRDNYRHFAAVGSTLYFSLDDDVHGQEIWKSDGTEAGTLSVTNFDNGVAPASLIEVAGTLYFWLSDDTTHENSGLYKLDESTSTATLIKAFSSDDFELSTSEITSENGRLYMEVIDYPNARREYWTSDGTEAGTFKLVDGEHMGG